MDRASFLRSRTLFVLAGLLLLTAWLYAPALRFGFMWDDPLWYGRVIGKSLRELATPMSNYPFYRPATMLYNRLFLKADNTFDPLTMHAVQIGWHLLDIALVYALSRRLGLGKREAAAAGALMALYPLAHQAIAWVAPQQPMVTALQTGTWLAYIKARRQGQTRFALAGLSLLLFSIAVLVQENSAAMAFVPLFLEWTKGQQEPTYSRRRIPWLALAYLPVAAAFGLIWLALPRESGVTTLGYDPAVTGYFAQGFIFPLLGRPAGYAPNRLPTPGILIALAAVVVSALLAAAWRAGRIRQALCGLVWALSAILPSAIGLRYSYVSISARLYDCAAPGIALLWTCTLLPPAVAPSRRLWRAVGGTALALITLQSLLLIADFQRLYAAGTAHITELLQTAQTGEERLLFVNFPDRYAPRRPPYPSGAWWVTLAPGSVDLGAYPASVVGARPATFSRRMPWVDAEDRDAGPYFVDMRGELVQADQLYELAHQVDAIYLSRYHADGTFALQRAGAVLSPTLSTESTPACRLATFGETLCLQEAQASRQAGELRLTLTWIGLAGAQPNDTIFVHVGQTGQPPVAQADGDPWLGMLPLTMLQPGDAIQEQRYITLPEGLPPDGYEIRVGVYNRVTGQRLAAMGSGGVLLPENAFIVALSH